MNRTKRGYCTKNNHPRWRAWKADYDMTVIEWPWIGNFCTFCESPVIGVGSGAPHINLLGKLRVLRGLKEVTPNDVNIFQKKMEHYNSTIKELKIKQLRFLHQKG